MSDGLKEQLPAKWNYSEGESILWRWKPPQYVSALDVHDLKHDYFRNLCDWRRYIIAHIKSRNYCRPEWSKFTLELENAFLRNKLNPSAQNVPSRENHSTSRTVDYGLRVASLLCRKSVSLSYRLQKFGTVVTSSISELFETLATFGGRRKKHFSHWSNSFCAPSARHSSPKNLCFLPVK